jgi:nitrite reductase/ring-hydroxylating ferredoxin subunit
VWQIRNPGAKGFTYREGSALFAGLLIRKGKQVMGYEDLCPHAGWPLGTPDGKFLTRTGEHILCSAHGALFSLEEGLCVAGPCLGDRLSPWPVEVRKGAVYTL